MKPFLVFLIAFIGLRSAHAESHVGFDHPASYSDVRSASDDPAHETVFLKLKAKDPNAQELAIRYEVKSMRVVAAWWMTKGNIPLVIPGGGSLMPKRPEHSKSATVCLSRKELTDVTTEKVAFLFVKWSE